MSRKSFYAIDLLICVFLIVVIAGEARTAPLKMTTKNLTSIAAENNNDRAQIIDSDRIKLPSATVKFLSPTGEFQFFVTTKDSWATTKGQGKSIASIDNKLQVLWEKTLPQEYGPRYVLVGLRGEVLMLDEKINVKSKHAIVIVNPTGDRTIRYSFDEIEQVVRVPAAIMVARATQGSWWISAPPYLDKSGLIAYVNTAGKVLQIDLVKGKISLVKSPHKEL
jgi:hypothetical protein